VSTRQDSTPYAPDDNEGHNDEDGIDAENLGMAAEDTENVGVAAKEGLDEEEVFVDEV